MAVVRKNQAGYLLEAFANASDALFEAGVTRSDLFVGDIGEFIASKTLGFELVDRSVAAIDGTRGGRKYQVKSISDANPRARIRLASLKPGFDVLVGVRLTDRYAPIEVIEVDAVDLPDGIPSLTNSRLDHISHRRHTAFPPAVTKIESLLREFGEAYQALLDKEIIRTRRVVGDLGEQYAADTLGLHLMEDLTQAGYDAEGSDGRTYEIKTRRVYQSERRTSDTRRINGLASKTADVLVVVTLDHAFRCSRMWTMPLANVHNPKSATLKSVVKTPGIKRVR